MPKYLPSLDQIHTVVFDFDGVFTDNKVWVDQEGRESVCVDRADGLAMDMVRYYQAKKLLKADFFILSKESNSVVLRRAEKLRLECFHGVGDKLKYMEKHFFEKLSGDSYPFSGLIYLGNDLNDLPLMHKAGYSIAPSDAHTNVKSIADMVMDQRGGNGFVRAFIEKLLKIDQLSKEKINELISNC